MLNQKLVEQQELSQHEVQYIETLHEVRLRHIGEMSFLDPKENQDQLLELAGKIRTLDFQLQEAWHFPQDENFHRFWELPHCSCPKMDNEDRWGTEYMIRSVECIFHGINPSILYRGD
jgi:hypothetical protein